MFKQHGRSRSMGRSSFTLRPSSVGAPNRSVFIRALLARRGVEDGVRRLRRRLEKAEAALLAVEGFEARAAARDDKAEACAAVAHIGEGRYGDARGHWRLPTRSPHASKQAIARSTPAAQAEWPPASLKRARKSSCASVGRPPDALSSSAKELPWCQSKRSLAPARTPMRLSIAPVRASRAPPFGQWSHSTSGLARNRKCATTAS